MKAFYLYLILINILSANLNATSIPKIIDDQQERVSIKPPTTTLDELENYKNNIASSYDNFLGYPGSPTVDRRIKGTSIQQLSHMHVNNVGDPYEQGGFFTLHSKKYEREVIDFFGELFQIENAWGYVPPGGTEGNLEGLWIGRNYLKNTYGQSPIFLTSEASHYSLKKNADILNLDLKLVKVNSEDELDIDAFRKAVQSIDPNRPILLNVNIGTTMKGAVDDFSSIIDILRDHHPDKFYIHADMALYGLIYRLFGSYPASFPQYIGSFSISGHKLLALQHACGIFISKKNLVDKAFPDQWVNYIGSSDKTVGGSRNGNLSLMIHDKIKNGIEPIKEEIAGCIDLCYKLFNKMKKEGLSCEMSYDKGIIISFPQPKDEICQKYQLACYKTMAHVVIMPHVTEALVNRFLKDMLEAKNNQRDD